MLRLDDIYKKFGEITAVDGLLLELLPGKQVAYIVLPEGFGATRQNLFHGEATRIEIGVDPSRKAAAAMLEGILTAHYMEGLMSQFNDPTAMRGQLSRRGLDALRSTPPEEREEMAVLERFLVGMDTAFGELQAFQADTLSESEAGAGWQPLEFQRSDVAIQRQGPKNSFEVTFPQALIWAMIGCAAASGISLVVERTRGTLVRLRLAPLSLAQILAGKGLACFGAIMVVGLLLMVIFTSVFGVKPGSYLLFILALASSAICFVGIMMLLSVLGRTEASAGGIGWAALLIMAMLGGGMVPLFFMPTWIRAVSSISPVKWAVLTIEGAVWRGFSVETMLWHYALLVGIGAAFFAIGARVFRITAR